MACDFIVITIPTKFMKERWLTPYTDNLADIVEYAKYNNIHVLVVDTLDFKTYRPALHELLDETKAHE